MKKKINKRLLLVFGFVFLALSLVRSQNYEYYLTEKLLNAWYPTVKDNLYGGYLSDFEYDWTPTGENTKLVVSQARHVWVTSKAALLFPDEPMYAELARHGFDFLKNKMWDNDYGGFYYHMDRSGNTVIDNRKRIYGEAFAIYGLSAYYLVSGSEEARDLAIETFHWIEEHGFDKDYNSYHQYTNRQGTPLLSYDKEHNNILHLIEAYTALYNIYPDQKVYEAIKNIVYLVDEKLQSPEGFLYVNFNRDLTPSSNNYNDVAFGHNIQLSYLLYDAYLVMNEEIPDSIQMLIKNLADHTIEYGFDEQFGGLFNTGHFYNPGYGIIDDEKNWWTEAEALNTLILMKNLYPDEIKYKDNLDKHWTYVKKYVIDTVYGGWYSTGLDTRSSAKTSNKGHIWKTPYHTGRSLINAYMDENPDNENPTEVNNAGIYNMEDNTLLVQWDKAYDNRYLVGYDIYLQDKRTFFTLDTFLVLKDVDFTADSVLAIRSRDLFYNRSEEVFAKVVSSSSPTKIETDIFSEQISVYPNPIDQQINIAVNAPSVPHLKVDIFTIDGRKVLEFQMQGNTEAQLNAGDLQAGIYILRVSNSKHHILFHQQLIKK